MAYEYQDWYQKLPKYETREQVKCPVCKSILGYRNIGESFMEHCEECKATFTWKLADKVPSVLMDSDKKKSKKCTCNNCS
jgi:hypothetical protein